MNEQPPSDDLDMMQRTLLRLLHSLLTHAGQRNVTYRYCRQEVFALLHPEAKGTQSGFQWGFEAQFNNAISGLRDCGLINAAFGTSTIMAGKAPDRKVYSMSLTEAGLVRGLELVEKEGPLPAAQPHQAPATGQTGAHGANEGEADASSA